MYDLNNVENASYNLIVKIISHFSLRNFIY